MPTSNPSDIVLADIARLQEQIVSLEKQLSTLELALRTEFNLKNLSIKDEMKGIKVTLRDALKRVQTIEIRFAKYAGGYGILTAIVLKLCDKIHF